LPGFLWRAIIILVRWPGWLGVGERRWRRSPDEDVQPPKTLWDFVQLLIVPVLLVVIALSFNASQASRDRRRAETARQDATLDAYFARMSELMLDDHLLTSKPGDDVRHVARTITLATIRRVDGMRKGEVIQFLTEAGLLTANIDQTSIPVVGLAGANLRGVDLTDAVIGPEGEQGDAKGVLLYGDFRGARFDGAWVSHVFFPDGADLRDASFKRGDLSHVGLDSADLRGASFADATLNSVNFSCSTLDGATFDDAHFYGGFFDLARLDDVRFVGAVFNKSGSDRLRLTTYFDGAEGRGVDFSHAENLSSLRVLDTDFTELRLDGVERPKGWGPNGPPVHAKPDFSGCPDVSQR
jgi:uncharacterized protein YjbI with pentapeptide repeats